MKSYLTKITHYLQALSILQLFSIFLLLITLDQTTNSLLIFISFTFFFFSLFSQLYAGALLSTCILGTYFLRNIFGGSEYGKYFISILVLYSLILTVILIILPPDLLGNIKDFFHKIVVTKVNKHLTSFTSKDYILLIGEIGMVVLFCYWLYIDIYKSFLGRELVWSTFNILGLLLITLRFLFVNPLIGKGISEKKI